MLWVGQFSIVDGEAREESPWIGVFPESARVEPEESSDLFVIVEPALEGSEEYCRDLSQVIGKQFRERRLSLTGGILRALKGAHESLRDWNRRSLKQHRVAAGVSCLALRGGAPGCNAYLGQVAPAAVADDGGCGLVAGGLNAEDVQAAVSGRAATRRAAQWGIPLALR